MKKLGENRPSFAYNAVGPPLVTLQNAVNLAIPRNQVACWAQFSVVSNMKLERTHRSAVTTYALFLGVLLLTNTVSAHDWHRHGGTSTPATVAAFTIPAAAGSEPADSAAVARLAEPFSSFHDHDVRYHWDDTYFYVESNSMPDHEMFTGITSWQQQVALPQDYYVNNAWSIPLNPVVAQNPVMLDSNLFRGAVALAVNGIPVFNALNNRGDDAFLEGELDNFGGHAGRGDDYHYHIAPLHLIATVGIDQPIAFGLDGYPLYGLTEADGSAVTGLDTLNGHDTDYHYHATEAYPYIMAGMRGEVTVSNDQIEPQPRNTPVRPATDPLNGATITGFSSPQTNSYSLTYSLSGQDYAVNWSVDAATNDITFEFVDPGGSSTTETYTDAYNPRAAYASSALSFVRLGSGNARFTMTGEPGFGYQFESSVDSQTFDTFGFRLLDGTGTNTFDLERGNMGAYLRALGATAVTVAVTPESHNWIATGATGFWDDGANWDAAGEEPEFNWDVVLDNSTLPTGKTVTVDADALVKSVEISGAAGSITLNIQQGVTVTVTDGIEVLEGGILKGKGTLVGDIVNQSGNVDVGMPEPSTGVLFLIGIIAGGFYHWRSR